MSTSELIRRARAYAETAGLKETTVARKLLGGGAEFSRIEAGGSVLERTLQKAFTRLDALECGLTASQRDALTTDRAPTPQITKQS